MRSTYLNILFSGKCQLKWNLLGKHWVVTIAGVFVFFCCPYQSGLDVAATAYVTQSSVLHFPFPYQPLGEMRGKESLFFPQGR